MAFDLDGPLPGNKGLRFSCGSPHDIEIPFAGGETPNPILQLGLRVFTTCTAGKLPPCKGDIQVGYGLADDPRRDIHPLTNFSYNARDLAHANNIDTEIANTSRSRCRVIFEARISSCG